MSRRRPISDEDHAIWTRITRSVTPLRPKARPAKSAKPAIDHDETEIVPAPPRIEVRAKPHTPAKAPPLAPLERRLKQRIARGRDPIEARIDLHGLTQSQAHAVLLRFLRSAQADGAKIVLVVTGKGTGGNARDPAAERGVLKRQVPLWLALPEFRSLVVGFEDAHSGHGGQGALYVRLRRIR
jgi:DNA-nicking Smr family endonuclease